MTASVAPLAFDEVTPLFTRKNRLDASDLYGPLRTFTGFRRRLVVRDRVKTNNGTVLLCFSFLVRWRKNKTKSGTPREEASPRKKKPNLLSVLLLL